MRFVLASASPRRAALLAQAGIVPVRIVAPEVDETPKKENCRAPMRCAWRSAKAVAAVTPRGAAVLAADTVVALGRRILPKAEDGRGGGALPAAVLRAASSGDDGARADRAREENPYTDRGHARRVQGPDARARSPTMSRAAKARGKAGGYAIQGRAEAFVRSINGSYSNVVGLPLYETVGLLEGAGGQANDE